jgi:hypothetical protein
MTSPTPRHLGAQLHGQDAVTLVLALRAELTQLRRDIGQAGKRYGWTVTTPALPATTVAVTNDNTVPVTVYITGGTVTDISVAGTALGMTSGTFRVNPGDNIAVTYSVAPTWHWYGD